MCSLVLQKIKNKYYHVTFSCDQSEEMFSESSRCEAFVSLLETFLYGNKFVDCLAFCLDKKSGDLLLYQKRNGAVAKLIHDLAVGYGFYLKNNGNKSWFLDKTCHKSTVPARKILSISKSIHTRPDDYVTFPYSSIRAYLYDDVPKWLDKSHIAKRYNSALKYSELLNSTL